MKRSITIGNIEYTIATTDKQSYTIKIGRKLIAKTSMESGKVRLMRKFRNQWLGGYSNDSMQDTILNFLNEEAKVATIADSLMRK